MYALFICCTLLGDATFPTLAETREAALEEQVAKSAETQTSNLDAKLFASLAKESVEAAIARLRTMPNSLRGDYAVALVQLTISQANYHSAERWLDFIASDLKDSQKHVAIGHYWRARILEKAKSHTASLAQSEAALRKFRALKENDWYESTLLVRAGTLHLAGRMVESAKAFSQLAALAQKRNDGLLTARYQLEAAMVNYKSGRIQEADSDLQKAIPVFREHSFRHGLAMAHKTKASIVQAQGRSQEALGHLRKARELFSETGHQHELGNCSYNVGLILLQAGRIKDARAYLMQGIYEFSESGSASAVGMCYNELGETYMRSGSLQKAELAFGLARIMLTRSHNRFRLAKNEAYYGALRVKQGRPDLARKHFMVSAAIYEEIGLADRAKATRTLIAKLPQGTSSDSEPDRPDEN